jgi:hypothetical protein
MLLSVVPPTSGETTLMIRLVNEEIKDANGNTLEVCPCLLMKDGLRPFIATYIYTTQGDVELSHFIEPPPCGPEMIHEEGNAKVCWKESAPTVKYTTSCPDLFVGFTLFLIIRIFPWRIYT